MRKQHDLYKFEPMLGPSEDVPIGSVDWAERVSNRLQVFTNTVSVNTLNRLTDTIREIWRADPKPWDIWPGEKPFRTPDDYCRAVTGHTWEGLIGALRELGGDDFEVTEFEMRSDLARAQVEHRKQGAHVADGHRAISTKRGSTNRAYLLRRLARDHPDILARYERGEFKSVRAAAIEAGIVKQSTLLERVLKALPKLTPAGRLKVRRTCEQLDQSKTNGHDQPRLNL